MKQPLIPMGLLAAMAVIAGGWFYFSRPDVGAPAWPEVIEETKAADKTTGLVRRLTDGVLITPEQQPKRWFAVMVENSAEAWPLSGLSQARLVIEAPVESAIPRFMVYFDDTQSVAKIGPVRSLRPYYLDWAMGFNAMAVHVGGSPQALAAVISTRAMDLNEFFWARFFWRSKDRYAPHNTYTSVEHLIGGYEARGYEEIEIPSWTYTDEVPELDARPQEQSITIPFSTRTSDYTAGWKYDRESNAYRRWQGVNLQKDADGSGISTANVVVLFTNIRVIDAEGRREVNTEGTGEAWLFRDGTRVDVQWQKDALKDPLRFVDDAGTAVALNPGTTWIEVLPLSTSVIVAP
ncbi:MAG: DUF3048 domain-containing protein [Parcubacteria group bacterium]|nr:DUF3048 domain-containing protein [Parcubacteria group bacterium]